jgi:hypothetical protein
VYKRQRGLGDVYKRQTLRFNLAAIASADSGLRVNCADLKA